MESQKLGGKVISSYYVNCQRVKMPPSRSMHCSASKNNHVTCISEARETENGTLLKKKKQETKINAYLSLLLSVDRKFCWYEGLQPLVFWKFSLAKRNKKTFYYIQHMANYRWKVAHYSWTKMGYSGTLNEAPICKWVPSSLFIAIKREGWDFKRGKYHQTK